MKFSLSWLQQHLKTDKTSETIAATLVSLGHEIEAMEDTSKAFNNVVVGKVLERVQHPDADRLGVCQVEVGAGDVRQIVCGAPNARAGITVAVALEGAVLPGDFKIKKSKIRGVESNGMICSVKELGMGHDHEGIWEMEVDAAAGTPLMEATGGADVLFETSLTPNRGDALSVRGTARDLAAAKVGELMALPNYVAGTEKSVTTCKTETELCPYFCGVQIKGIDAAVATPDWMVQRLEQGGMRSIGNAVVDITNFVMLDLGQPLHAYDQSKVKGIIRAVTGRAGEAFEGVVGDNKIELTAEDIAIVDDNGVIGLAGIMGGKNTDVTAATTAIFLEAAWFNKTQIAKSGQHHNIISDARFRFERGIDPAMTPVAMLKAANLIVDLCGGEMSAMVEAGANQQTRAPIKFNPQIVETFGGLKIATTEIINSLEALGFVVKGNDNNLVVTAPSWATIMDTDADLVEEVLRLQGYDSVPAVVPAPMTTRQNIDTRLTKINTRARRQLVAMGYLEALTYSFISAKKATMFAEGVALQELDNPLDEENMSTMRPSLVPGLLDALAKNRARSESVSALVEVGKTFTAEGETLMAAGLRVDNGKRSWKGKMPTPDVFSAKRDALKFMASLGIDTERLQIKTGAASYYHPGRSGIICQGPKVLAQFGEVHPKAAKLCGVKGQIAVFELNLNELSQVKVKVGQLQTSEFQPVSRDLAFVVAQNVAAGDIVSTIKKADKELLQNVELFDVYTGDKLPAGKKSLAFSLTLQAMDRTMKDDEINQVVKAAIAAVEKNYEATLRD